jgi:signal transduction histidine kinase
MGLAEIYFFHNAKHKKNLRQQVENWIQIRFFLVYLLFGTLLLYRPSLNMPYPVPPILGTILLIILFNCLSLILINYKQWINYLAYAQVAVDFIIITIIYQITGGVDSPFDWLYLYVILTAGLVGGLKFALLSSLLSVISMTLVLLAQYNFILPHYHVGLLAKHLPTGFIDSKVIFSEIYTNGLMFFSIGLISGYISNLAETRRLNLIEAHQMLKQQKEKVLQAITAIQEDERKRIARELHDQTGQTLNVLIANLQILETKLTSEPDVQKQLLSLSNLAEKLLDEVHDLIFDLRPSVLDDLGVIASLKWYARTYIQPLHIDVEILIRGEERRLDEKREIILYRFLQEALSNVIKHAKATKIEIIFEYKPNSLQIEVQDNGVGFEVTEIMEGKNQRWGIVGMQERVEMLGGEYFIKTERGWGTCLSLLVPLEVVESKSKSKSESEYI